MRTFSIYLVLTAIVATLYFTIPAAFDRVEASECARWQIEATKYPNYFIKAWQKKQCKSHKIIINAPVK